MKERGAEKGPLPASHLSSLPTPSIITVIQARIGSKRLPAKVLKPFGDGLLIDAVHGRAIQLGPPVVWAIPTQSPLLAGHLLSRGWTYTEGPEDDVLRRYVEAARVFDADHIVRVTADCPFIDVEAGRWTISSHIDSGADFTIHVAEGRGIEVFTRGALEESHRLARDPFHREHSDEWILQNPQLYHIHRPKFSVDTQADLDLARRRLDGVLY